jgi:hypothetical protein
MVMIGDENSDDFVSVTTYSQSECQSKSRQTRLLGCFSEQFMKNLKLKIDAPIGIELTVRRQRGLVDKRY